MSMEKIEIGNWDEYVCRKYKEAYERRRKIGGTLKDGTAIPTGGIDLEDENTAESKIRVDEYAKATERDPKIMITTARNPSDLLVQFAKELELLFPNAQQIDRGSQVISEFIENFRAHDFTDVVFVQGNYGAPDALIITHLPFGPTAYFKLLRVVTGDDIKDMNAMTMMQQVPNVLFQNFTTKMEERTMDILKHLFPVPKIDTRRIISFTNGPRYISLRHLAYEKGGDPESAELKDIGPQFDMMLIMIKSGIVGQTEAQIEWIKDKKFYGS